MLWRIKSLLKWVVCLDPLNSPFNFCFARIFVCCWGCWLASGQSWPSSAPAVGTNLGGKLCAFSHISPTLAPGSCSSRTPAWHWSPCSACSWKSILGTLSGRGWSCRSYILGSGFRQLRTPRCIKNTFRSPAVGCTNSPPPLPGYTSSAPSGPLGTSYSPSLPIFKYTPNELNGLLRNPTYNKVLFPSPRSKLCNPSQSCRPSSSGFY